MVLCSCLHLGHVPICTGLLCWVSVHVVLLLSVFLFWLEAGGDLDLVLRLGWELVGWLVDSCMLHGVNRSWRC